MRRIIGLAVAVFMLPVAGYCQQQGQSSSQTSSQSTSSASDTQQNSVADAARKALQQQHKDSTKQPKVFTNDNLPTSGGVSTVGATPTSNAPSEGAAGETGKAAPIDEKGWRDKFAALHKKLDQDQSELDVLQREANVDQVQFYGGDPQKAQQDSSQMQPMGAEYNKKISEIDAKKKQVEADQQAISDAEDALRKSGGDSGWAR